MLKLLNGAYQYDEQCIAFPDITIARGELVGLYGPSGCGKSTVAQIFAGLKVPQRGVLSSPLRERGCNAKVQWISQSPEFAFNPRWKIQRSLAESYAVPDDVLQRYQIQPAWLTRKPNQLSGGELQRLNIVRALAPSTEFLLCDEITAQLDTVTQQQIWQVLKADIVQRNLGALVISHSLPLLDALCDRVIEMPA
ncbi:ATP-binding cassette domain-containing protein [Thaumasiovibrio sp. DFM-14]|uniref:ATP-binding cassette domain-containing protein n=1 Tax=Thaumasiovibrio sp. DFM-14 TaxID=3384792 RepID=UPI0039A17647